ncbi:transglycosylase domain-containing protein [Methylocystis sp. MJC1]|jgi:penicillin-binding protein 1C|uniref:transglycosylase domain-containing protein n=1 Tax=Methylocystis sp. MJC1 TaxID=2654282 RepID=UPI0013EA6D2C|nr:transglycosylase domain-containing protein [Methylocystis sp. MJC1]KAF2990268.1 Penicillin-binding protein 2D [Methylocystis sp. MJC1]MBU6528036.1 transglycosylase domain-containing protein [Methylocystis sp. MJC1]UZX10953.1 transglycosylase domain-containing protein [Methylocystis sp. MJC1]
MSRFALLAALAFISTALRGGIMISQEAAGSADLDAPPASQIVYDRSGAFITQIGNARHDEKGEKRVDYGYWPLERIPERVARATLILEDRRFYAHAGVDPRAVARALWNNLAHRRQMEGASTIAMQVARMQQPEPRTYANKFWEAATALAIIARQGREATLSHYLRLAPYGLGSHGIAHAARFYFDKPVEDLSWAQVALLAAIPQSPGRMNVTRESGLRLAVERARYAIAQLEKEGPLDAAQAELARRELAAMRPLAAKRRPETLHLALRYERLAREGRVRAASQYDPRIHATIDLSIEREATQLARRYLSIFRNAGARQVAIMVAERGSNAIIADVGSADYNDPRAGAFDFTRAPRSPGSTLKPFIYALALERGALKPTDLLDDLPEGASGVANADGLYLGPLTPRQALANSRNVPATNLLRRVGLEANFLFLHELGLHDLEAAPESFGVSMAIGALPTRLENLMRAYAALADDGVMHDLSFARDEARAPPRRVMSLDTARLVTSFLSDPQARLPSFPRYGPLEYPFAVAVKTGTSQNYRDAWALAFSHKFIVGVWIGRGDASGMRALTGASSAARLAHAMMTKLHGTKPGDLAPETFAPPPGRVAIDLCRADAGPECPQTLREWVRPDEISARPAAHAPTPVEEALAAESGALVIATPEHNMHIWRNPEQPAPLNKLALKLTDGGKDAQIVWLVDGAPFAVAQADETVFWPMTPGAHRIQARLALAPVTSRPVRVIIE